MNQFTVWKSIFIPPMVSILSLFPLIDIQFNFLWDSLSTELNDMSTGDKIVKSLCNEQNASSKSQCHTFSIGHWLLWCANVKKTPVGGIILSIIYCTTSEFCFHWLCSSWHCSGCCCRRRRHRSSHHHFHLSFCLFIYISFLFFLFDGPTWEIFIVCLFWMYFFFICFLLTLLSNPISFGIVVIQESY